MFSCPYHGWSDGKVIQANLYVIDDHGQNSLALDKLASFKRPHEIVATGRPFPRSLSGKVLKRELAAILRDARPGAVPLV